MRPDRLAALRYEWDGIANNTIYGLGVYYEPHLHCFGPHYDANYSNNSAAWMKQWTIDGGAWTFIHVY